MQKYNRILIIGNCGAGKSTLSKKISDIFNLPIYHIDKYYWQPNWIETPKDEYTEQIRNIIDQEKWIIDGNNKSTFNIRMPRADAIIFLDLLPVKCCFRAIKRRFLNKERKDMAEGCVERINFEFYKYILGFRSSTRPIVLESKNKYGQHADFFHIKNNSQLNEFMEMLQDYESWSFGTSAENLLSLVKSGKKTATTSLYVEGESLSSIGERSYITNSNGKKEVLVEITKVEIKAFNEVDKAFAEKEGEGDLSLNHWRKTHKEFFVQELNKMGFEFRDDFPVVCEEFKLIKH